VSVSSPADRIVAAAGGAVWRRSPDGGTEVVLVHRPRYDDWSVPKGKLDAGEHALTAAVREIGEETGLAAVAGRRSLRTSYPVPEGVKRVDYWVMQALGGAFEPDHEVDDLRWLPVPEAADLCSHEQDRAVLADLARTDVPAMPTLVLVRHGRAGSRSDWDGPDDLRPLDERGAAQAQRLAEVLPAFGPVELLSAPPVRCRDTVEPLADRLGLDIGPAPELSEEGFEADPDAGLALVERLLAPRDRPGVTVVCSQGGAIPSVLMALGVQFAETRDYPPCAKGSAWVLGGRPGALIADYYRDFDPDPEAPALR
jgi:8-oxo-dGTP pyrophosphatase MutT (NUDIX family)/phosphohistidine phosphatase SixA